MRLCGFKRGKERWNIVRIVDKEKTAFRDTVAENLLLQWNFGLFRDSKSTRKGVAGHLCLAERVTDAVVRKASFVNPGIGDLELFNS